MTGPSSKLPLDILLLFHVMESLWPRFHRARPFTHFSRSQMEQMLGLGWVIPRPRMCVLVVAELVSLGHWDCPLRQGVEPALLGPCLWGQLPHSHGEGRANFPVSREGQSELCQGW